MGVKRSAKEGDFKQLAATLEVFDGSVEGTPRSLPRKLKFDGGWKEFQEHFGDRIVQVDIGRYAIALESPTSESHPPETAQESMNPEIYAMCAATFLLGEGQATDFEPYTSRYDGLHALIGALAAEIDTSIGGLYLPPETDRPILLYRVTDLNRELVYESSGDRFSVFGSEILTHV